MLNRRLGLLAALISLSSFLLFCEEDSSSNGQAPAIVTPTPTATPTATPTSTATPAGPRLAFKVQPAAVVASQLLSPVVVEVQTGDGKALVDSAAQVTITLDCPAAVAIDGTLEVAARAGTATFADLRVRRAATGCKLHATAPSVADAVSSAFDVLPTSLTFGDPIDIAGPGYDITAVDLDGDQIPDLVIGSGAGLNILRGLGDGGFVSAPSPTVSGAVLSVASADVNGDSKPDLFVHGQGGVSVFLNTADGGLVPGPTPLLATGPSPGIARLVNLNRDGVLDVIATNQSQNLFVFFGTGDGGYVSQDPLATGVQAALQPTTGQFRPDSGAAEDIVLMGQGGADAVFIANDGDGGLAVKNANIGQPIHGAAGDLNGDSLDDLVFGRDSTQAVNIGLSQSDGGFAVTPIDAGREADEMRVVDLNLDGKPDVVATLGYGSSPASLLILVGKGDGTVTPLPQLSLLPYSATTAVADFNHDGRPDIAVLHQTGGIRIFLQK